MGSARQRVVPAWQRVVASVDLRAAWGLYYAQSPTIFIPTGSGRTAVLFCFFNSTCVPPGGFPNLFPDNLQTDDPLLDVIGNPGINYIIPSSATRAFPT